MTRSTTSPCANAGLLTQCKTARPPRRTHRASQAAARGQLQSNRPACTRGTCKRSRTWKPPLQPPSACACPSRGACLLRLRPRRRHRQCRQRAQHLRLPRQARRPLLVHHPQPRVPGAAPASRIGSNLKVSSLPACLYSATCIRCNAVNPRICRHTERATTYVRINPATASVRNTSVLAPGQPIPCSGPACSAPAPSRNPAHIISNRANPSTQTHNSPHHWLFQTGSDHIAVYAILELLRTHVRGGASAHPPARPEQSTH